MLIPIIFPWIKWNEQNTVTHIYIKLIQVAVLCHQIEPPSWFVGLDPKRLDWNPQIMSKVQDMPNSTPEKIGHLWQTRRARVGKRKRNLKPHKYYFWVKFSLPLPLPLSLLNPLSPSIHKQILQTDLYTFP